MKNLSSIEIGKRIRQIRKERRLSQAKFGELIGDLKWHRIRDLESGKTKPSADFIRQIAVRLQISDEWLLEGKGEKSISKRFQEWLRRTSELQGMDAANIQEGLKEKFAMLDFLEHLGIRTREQLEEFLTLRILLRMWRWC
jgi:transcriptional regulator with XRE-family HTH domain